MANNTEIMSGYDYELVDDVPDEYICCICRLIIRNPVQTKCGHRFCKVCLDAAISTRNKQCPVDREKLGRNDIFNDKAAERRILSFKVKCPHQGCDWQGELRDAMQHTKGCSLAVVSCSYQKFGCDFKGKREILNDHIVSNHLAFTTEKLLELQSENAVTASKLREVQNENATLKRRFSELENENREQAKKLKLKPGNVNQPITYIWEVTNFNEKLQDAKEETAGISALILLSDLFYSEKFGYKLKFLLYPDGSKDGKGTHLSVFLVVVQGEYDALLPWPFQKKVEICLIDQKQDLSKRKNIKKRFSSPVRNYSKGFDRPTANTDISRGFNTFVSHETLITESYIVDGSLFLQLELEDC